jgi:hypothetical protein
MPNSSTTPVVDSSTTTNAAIALAYGPVWVTGKRAEYYELQNTGSSNLDFTRVGVWLLGEGEWDGCDELWINDTLIWRSEWDDTTQFHFHRGCDAVIGSGLSPYSSGPDQGVDSFFSAFPTAVNPLAYSRIAYYAIKRKQPIQNQTNTHQNDPTQWADLNPIGLWRSTKVRLFDAEGNQTAYAYSTNPAWHFVDAILRRKIFPEYNIDLNAGIDQISAAAQNRFDWGSIYSAAQYFDQVLANGRRRFTGAYAFSQTTTLAAILEQILKCCRSFQREYAGQISLIPDQTRPSVFTFSRYNILPGSPSPSDKAVSQAPNCYVAKFRDLLVPTSALVESITCAVSHNPVVTTQASHPYNTGDILSLGGTGTIYDGVWTVYSVPDADAYGNCYSLTLSSKGANYPTSVGAGGSIGLLYSRLKERAPQFDHETNQLARGAVGVGLPRQRNRVRVEYDYAISTFDQASRISRFERDLALGPDQSPYVTPKAVTLKAALFAADAAESGAVVAQIQCGDHVTLDDTANYAYAGEYAVLDATHRPYNATASGSGGSLALTPAADGGEVELTLGPYLPSDAYDTTDPNSAGWSNVPGSDPDNDSDFTSISMANGGTFAFFTGSLPSGSQFQLPSTGFAVGNMLAWAGPAGTNVNYHSLRIIQMCSVDANRVLTLIYSDCDGTTWGGDVNFAALSWMSSDKTSTSGSLTWLELTLLGGETIVFGQGVLADGSTVVLPAGYSTGNMFAVAYPHDSPQNWKNAQSVGAYVDSSHVVHFDYIDSGSNMWHGNAAVLVFAWKNNMGTVTTETDSGANWMHCPLTNGTVFGVGCAKNLANGATFVLPSCAGEGSTLQPMVGSSDGSIQSGHHAQGVGSAYLDASNVVHITFNDGSGNVWSGTADVFALFCEPSSASSAGISVSVSPASMSIALNGTLQFTAYVSGTSTTTVTWSVDGVAGGNATVGTIDASGNYTAPGATGLHTITATSTVNTAAFASQGISVGTGSGASGAGTVSIVVTPSKVIVPAGGACQFAASVNGASGTAVVWSVDGLAGGNAVFGTIDSNGVYVAGTAPGLRIIRAALASNSSVLGSATVGVNATVDQTRSIGLSTL